MLYVVCGVIDLKIFQYDIREASQEIRDSYKMYYKLKTSFLEDTLNDVLSDDGFDVLEMSQREGELDISLTEDSINGGPKLPLDISSLVEADHQHQENSIGFSNVHELSDVVLNASVVKNHENRVLKEFEAVEELDLNKNAWGDKVSMKTKPTTTKKDTPRRSFKPNFNDKLFNNSSFSKRNPRKSVSKSTLDSSLRSNQNSSINDTLNISKTDVLPDLETILLEKAKEQQKAAANISANPLLVIDKNKDVIKTHVDEGWLERNAMQNGLASKIINKSIQKEQNNNRLTPSRKSSYGLSNIDVSKLQTLSATNKPEETETNYERSDNFGGNLIDGNPAGPQEDHVEEMLVKNINEYRKKPNKPKKDSDSDSVVDDSEEENEPQEYRHIVKRRKIMPTTTPKIEQPKDVEKTSQVANVPIRKGKQNTTESTGALEDNEDKKDFEASSDGDADYKQPKNTKRKKAVAKRKTAAAKTKKSSPKEKSKPKTKVPVPKTRVSKRAATKSKEPTEEEEEEVPLDPEDLKYTLALDRGDITSVPRIKQSDLDKADHLAQEYINKIATMSVATVKPIALTAAAEKRAAAKRKLEEKIASGKLNENFVTINIQKKTFVRGKKTINYSKYKKKLWKDKKRVAALTGPDMDMRGCDGGTLKCFTCGQAGHFAQNCKVKGDSLLPLTAQLEEDPSPFPTLEEAEQMASQSALAVHSRNISKLPQAANAAIYQNNQLDDMENDEDDVEVRFWFHCFTPCMNLFVLCLFW